MSCEGEQAVTTRLVIDTLAGRYKFKVELSSFPSLFFIPVQIVGFC